MTKCQIQKATRMHQVAFFSPLSMCIAVQFKECIFGRLHISRTLHGTGVSNAVICQNLQLCGSDMAFLRVCCGGGLIMTFLDGYARYLVDELGRHLRAIIIGDFAKEPMNGHPKPSR